jgi:hypothetical protein
MVGLSHGNAMIEWLLSFLFGHDMIEVFLIFLGGSTLIASVLLHRDARKRYASTWASSETGSQDVSGGPYREGQITVTSLVPGEAPALAQAAAFSGHALSLYLAIFLPFFLPIAFNSPDCVTLTVVVIATGVATRRSAHRILDGSALPGVTSVVVPAMLGVTGVIALLPWSSAGATGRSQIALVNVVLPIWAAVQAALILASASAAQRIAKARDGLGRQEE